MKAPNPTGREGRPISLAGFSFDEVVRKALNTPVPAKATPKPTKKKQPQPKR